MCIMISEHVSLNAYLTPVGVDACDPRTLPDHDVRRKYIGGRDIEWLAVSIRDDFTYKGAHSFICACSTIRESVHPRSAFRMIIWQLNLGFSTRRQTFPLPYSTTTYHSHSCTVSCARMSFHQRRQIFYDLLIRTRSQSQSIHLRERE